MKRRKNFNEVMNVVKYKGKCWYCEYVIEGTDYRTVQVTLRDHILNEHGEEARKRWMKSEKMKKARRSKTLKWYVGWLSPFMITREEE